MSKAVMKMVLDALEDSVDLVQYEYEDALKLYGTYPTRAAKIAGLKAAFNRHEAAINELKTELEKHESEPVAWMNSGEVTLDRKQFGHLDVVPLYLKEQA